MYKGGNLTESIACGHGRFVFDLPFAPEKLEALISFKTTLLNFLFALATFLTYQSPPAFSAYHSSAYSYNSNCCCGK